MFDSEIFSVVPSFPAKQLDMPTHQLGLFSLIGWLLILVIYLLILKGDLQDVKFTRGTSLDDCTPLDRVNDSIAFLMKLFSSIPGADEAKT